MELRNFLYLIIVATVACGESIRVDNEVEAAVANDRAPLDNSREEYDTYTTSESPKHTTVPKTPPPIPKLTPITYKTTKKPAPQNDFARPQYTRVLHDVYKTPAPPVVYTVPPAVPVTSNSPRAEDYKKPEAIKPPPPKPVIPRTVNEADSNDSPTQTFSVPKSIVETFSQDPNSDPVEDIQPQPIPIAAAYLPPVAVYNPYPYVIPGGYPVPVYPRPSYPRVYNVGPLPYRTLGYSPPLAYTVPSPRNFAFGFPSSPSGLQLVYSSPSIGFGDGVAPVQYNSFIGGDYDDFLKKKKRR